jgi:hypothetical protein
MADITAGEIFGISSPFPRSFETVATSVLVNALVSTNSRSGDSDGVRPSSPRTGPMYSPLADERHAGDF